MENGDIESMIRLGLELLDEPAHFDKLDEKETKQLYFFAGEAGDDSIHRNDPDNGYEASSIEWTASACGELKGSFKKVFVVAKYEASGTVGDSIEWEAPELTCISVYFGDVRFRLEGCDIDKELTAVVNEFFDGLDAQKAEEGF